MTPLKKKKKKIPFLVFASTCLEQVTVQHYRKKKVPLSQVLLSEEFTDNTARMHHFLDLKDIIYTVQPSSTPPDPA